MNPWRTKAPDIKNVSLGSVARLTLDSIGTVRQVLLFLTMTKTSPTADYNFDPTLADVLNLIDLGIDDKAGKRQITAQELNEIQTSWGQGLAAQYYPQRDGNFNAVADSTETDNSVASTVRTGTWVLTLNFAEPSRDSYAARAFFGVPTIWLDRTSGATVKTAKVQFSLTVPGASTVASYVPTTSMATGKYNIKSPAYRAEVVYDKGASGPFVGDDLVNGQWVQGKNSTTTPMLPLTHFYRLNIGYSSTTPVIRGADLSFTGALQQMSIFSPNASGDDVTTYQFKKNGDTKLDSSKQADDLLKNNNDWNSARLQGLVPVLTASAAAVAAGGTGYSVGDVLNVIGGIVAPGGVPAQLKVASLSSSAAATFSVVNAGQYTVPPPTTAFLAGGKGYGATATLTVTAALFNGTDLSGVNWPAADVFHLAFDMDDNPFNAEMKAASDLFEFDLTLAQNTATNKNLICLCQVYRDALTS